MKNPEIHQAPRAGAGGRWLIPEWRLVLKRAWSIRLIAAAGALSGLEVALPFVEPFVAIPPGMFAALAAATTAAAFVARVLAQPGIGGCR